MMSPEEKHRDRKFALVTGATSGLGFDFAKLFAKDGYNLVLVARNEDRLMALAADLTQTFFVEVLPLSKDLFYPAAAGEIYEELTRKDIDVDILVTNAGQGEHGDFAGYDVSRDIDVIQLNITSLVSLTKYFLRDMLARNHGRILHVASMLGKYPAPYMTVSAAAKAFVISFTEGLARELKDSNVTITALVPGPSDLIHMPGAKGTATYPEENLSTPQEVAEHGYKAIMSGENKIVSGFRSEIYAAVSNLPPDSSLAEVKTKKMGPGDERGGRKHSLHDASVRERDEVAHHTGNASGDYDIHEDHVQDQ